MRLTDLRHKQVRGLDGERLGRVFEVHCEAGKVTALMCGPGSLLERLTARKAGRRIPWEMVKRVDAKAVIVAPDPPQKKGSTASASRSRQGTRRPTARPSKR
jgi:sporulation protein YlmC with PRC-barrel domain